MRSLGLDVGERRIGVALSDPEGIIATPFGMVPVSGDGPESDIARILELVRDHEAGTIVVGLPLSMDGTLGPQARRVQAFVDELSARSPVPVEVWDERLSTVVSQRLMRDAGTKKRRRQERRDAAAAAVILQGFLDRVRASRS
ncbi:MAG: Holliday junction resolvase RuvX [Dehalococcoidia bacterium]